MNNNKKINKVLEVVDEEKVLKEPKYEMENADSAKFVAKMKECAILNSERLEILTNKL